MPVLGSQCPYHPAILCPISLAVEKKNVHQIRSTISLFFLYHEGSFAGFLAIFFSMTSTVKGIVLDKYRTQLFYYCLIGYPYLSTITAPSLLLAKSFFSLCPCLRWLSGSGEGEQNNKMCTVKKASGFPVPSRQGAVWLVTSRLGTGNL